MADVDLDFAAPLFVPGHRPELFEKASRSGADAIIIDLEDAVPEAAKITARKAVRGGFTDVPVLVRVNGVGTCWHLGDLEAVKGLPISGLMLPKAELGPGTWGLCGLPFPVVALIESARGLADARAIAALPFVKRLAFGSVDFSAELGCADEHAPLAQARSELVLASHLGQLPKPLDGVTLALDDRDLLASDVMMARKFGFGGKLCIHPRQVEQVIEGFRPSPDEIAWAREVRDSGDGAVKVRGLMVDEPVRKRARAVLRQAGEKI